MHKHVQLLGLGVAHKLFCVRYEFNFYICCNLEEIQVIYNEPTHGAALRGTPSGSTHRRSQYIGLRDETDFVIPVLEVASSSLTRQVSDCCVTVLLFILGSVAET